MKKIHLPLVYSPIDKSMEYKYMFIICHQCDFNILYLLFCPSGVYTAPCYYYPNRAGVMGRPSFVVAVDLKSGDKPSDHWVKRGTALLMSLDL